mgnify:CR=1 FL=1
MCSVWTKNTLQQKHNIVSLHQALNPQYDQINKYFATKTNMRSSHKAVSVMFVIVDDIVVFSNKCDYFRQIYFTETNTKQSSPVFLMDMVNITSKIKF